MFCLYTDPIDGRLERFIDALADSKPALLPARSFAAILNSLPELERRLATLPEDPQDRTIRLRKALAGLSERESLASQCRVLRVVERIFTEAQAAHQSSSLPSEVVRVFNALTETARLRPIINEHETKYRRTTTPMLTAVDGDTFRTAVAVQLWFLLQGWQAGHRLRIKRCVSCKRWFVDQTRPAPRWTLQKRPKMDT